MRLVDSFLDVLLFARKFARECGKGEFAHDAVREEFRKLFAEAERSAGRLAYSADAQAGELPEMYPGAEPGQAPRQGARGDYGGEVFESAKYAVVAYVDELILCSDWAEKGKWQKRPLQREYFDTTNAGAGFYERLNALAKYGPERAVREVYCLCLGLGFKGKYFSTDQRQKLEEAKSFHLGLLLPEEAQRNLETATLFPSAYGGDRDRGHFKPRANLLPWVIGLPIVVVLATAFAYHRLIVELLDEIARRVG